MNTPVRKILMLAIVVALMGAPLAAGAVGGFTSPLFGLATAPNGNILVADTGAGIVTVKDGMIRSTLALPGVTDVSSISRSSMWAITAGQDPESDSGQGIHRIVNGNVTTVANLFAFEESRDPDRAGVDSNPFDVQSLGGTAALVADAGGNDLLKVNKRGTIGLVATFPDEVVSTENLQGLAGCDGEPIPDLAFICDIPEMPAQSVPTSIAIGPDGSYYVGELKGFPAPTGESRIWKIAPGTANARCGQSAACTLVFDGGFTSIIDLAFGPDGKLYVAELDEQSWAAVEFGFGGQGGTVNACDVGTLTCDVVAAGIPILTAMTFGQDGTLWVTKNALIPGAAEVIQVP